MILCGLGGAMIPPTSCSMLGVGESGSVWTLNFCKVTTDRRKSSALAKLSPGQNRFPVPNGSVSLVESDGDVPVEGVGEADRNRSGTKSSPDSPQTAGSWWRP